MTKTNIAPKAGLLNEIDQSLAGLHRTDYVEIGGWLYKLRTIDPSEHRWAQQAYGAVGVSQAIGARTGTLAVALVAIARTPAEGSSPEWNLIESMFEGDRASIEALSREVSPEEAVKLARRLKVAEWLDNGAKHPNWIEMLYGFWLEKLDKPRREAVTQLDPLRKKTPGGAPSDMSSLGQDGT